MTVPSKISSDSFTRSAVLLGPDATAPAGTSAQATAHNRKVNFMMFRVSVEDVEQGEPRFHILIMRKVVAVPGPVNTIIPGPVLRDAAEIGLGTYTLAGWFWPELNSDLIFVFGFSLYFCPSFWVEFVGQQQSGDVQCPLSQNLRPATCNLIRASRARLLSSAGRATDL